MDAVQDVTHTRAEMHVSRPDHDTLKVFFRSAVNLTMPFQKLATSSFLYSLADVTNNGAVVERACAPELVYLYGADEVRNDPTSMEDFRSLLANIPPGSLLYRWICSDDSGHIWEEIVPHLSCELKPLKIKVLNFEIQQANTKLNPSNPFKVKGPLWKMRRNKFPNMTTFM